MHRPLVLLALFLMAVPARAEDAGALLDAVSARDEKKVLAVLDAGVDVNAAVPETGEVALVAAAGLGQLKLVKTLLDRGADPNKVGYGGQTALIAASGEEWGPMVELLLAAGADPKRARPDGMNLVFQGINAHSLGWKGVPRALERALKAGADPNATIGGGFTPLMMAAREGQADLVKLLLAHGAKVDARTADGRTARGLAEKTGHAKVLELLGEAK